MHLTANNATLAVNISMSSNLSSTNPFHRGVHYSTPLEAFRSILQEKGYQGLFRGTLPRVALHSPSVAISWIAYEMGKGWLIC